VSWVVAVAVAGWALAVALACSMRRRLSLVADAEHELRGAAAAIALAAERMWRTGATAAFSSLVRLQLERMSAGLEDLSTAREWRRRAASVGDAPLDPGRLAQVLGNLAANATEHGVGAVDVKTTRIEISNRNRPRDRDRVEIPSGRGRGLAIAERAARELGGRLLVESHDGQTTAKLELPARPPSEAEAESAERAATAGLAERSGGDSGASRAA
jgi:two-component sensor histidine kinase